MTNLKFEEFALSEEMLKAIKKMGFEEASPIQSKTIGLILEGKDVVGQAHTGTGKTAAFGIPALEKIDHNSKQLQLIILCPTRELVLQVAQEIKNLAKYKEKINIVPVYGGQQIDTQLRALKKGAQVVVGTPGRTMDHLRRGSIDISTIKMVVLDEADEMLDMGFREDIETILKDSPKERQTIMFSATMEKDILRLTKNYQTNPVIVNVISEKANPLRIQQVYFEVLNKNKAELVSRLIDLHNIKLCLIFCNTKSQVDELVETLKTRGYFADGLHGDMNQNQREKIMRSFRSGSTEILVATDVAGRGIDVNDVEAVINYDLPRDDEDYVHRIGRTGRAGKNGKAFTFVSGKQIYNLKRIEKSNGALITRQNIPTLTELETIKINKISDEIKTVIEGAHLSSFVNHVEMIMGDECTSIDVAAALLKMILAKESENFDENVNFEELEKVEAPTKRRDRDFKEKRFGKDNKSKKRFSDRDKSYGHKKDKPDGFEFKDRGDKKYKKDKPDGFEFKDRGEKRYKKDKPDGFEFKDRGEKRYKKDKPDGFEFKDRGDKKYKKDKPDGFEFKDRGDKKYKKDKPADGDFKGRGDKKYKKDGTDKKSGGFFEGKKPKKKW